MNPGTFFDALDRLALWTGRLSLALVVAVIVAGTLWRWWVLWVDRRRRAKTTERYARLAIERRAAQQRQDQEEATRLIRETGGRP